MISQCKPKSNGISSDSKATTNEAVTLSERALALDPQNVRALTVLAGASLDLVSDQWSDDEKGARNAAAQLLKVYPGFTVQAGLPSTGATIRSSTPDTSASPKACARLAFGGREEGELSGPRAERGANRARSSPLRLGLVLQEILEPVDIVLAVLDV